MIEQLQILEKALPAISRLVKKSFDDAVEARRQSGIDDELIRDLAQARGEYTQEQKLALEQNEEPLIFDNYTEVKCAAANAWLSDILTGSSSEKPWRLVSTEIPSLPAHIEQGIVQTVLEEFVKAQLNGQMPVGLETLPEQQRQDIISKLVERRDDLMRAVEIELKREAEKRAERMDKLIYDQLQDGGFDEAFDTFIENFTKFRTAILRGPVVVNEKSVKFVRLITDNGSAIMPASMPELKYKFYAPNPLDIYPSAETVDPSRGVIHERARVYRKDIEALFGTEGVNEEELRQALFEIEMGQNKSLTLQYLDSQRAQLENKYEPTGRSTELVECIYYSGPVRGSHLIEWFGQRENQSAFLSYLDYYVDVILIGDRVVKVSLNPDPLGATNYYAASYRRVPGSFWGMSIPALMRDKQKVLNACMRALTTNMAFAAAPMAWADPSGLLPGESLESMHPRQIFQLRKRTDGSTTKPLEFFSPASRLQELILVADRMKEQIHDDVGIPPYQYGNAAVGGAGRTASGLSMLLTASARGIKRAIANIDAGVIKPLIKKMWVMNMLYHQDDSVKGDMDVVPAGITSLFIRDSVTMKRMSLLQSMTNQTDMMIIGLAGRAKLWREIFKGMDIDPTGIIPTDEELMLKLKAISEAQQNANAG